MSLSIPTVGSGLSVHTGDAQILAGHQTWYYVRRPMAALPQCSLTGRAGLGGDVISPVLEGLDPVLRSDQRGSRTMGQLQELWVTLDVWI